MILFLLLISSYLLTTLLLRFFHLADLQSGRQTALLLRCTRSCACCMLMLHADAACCTLNDACCLLMLHAERCMLHAEFCMLELHAECCMLHAAYAYAACCMLHVDTACMLDAFEAAMISFCLFIHCCCLMPTAETAAAPAASLATAPPLGCPCRCCSCCRRKHGGTHQFGLSRNQSYKPIRSTTSIIQTADYYSRTEHHSIYFHKCMRTWTGRVGGRGGWT